MALEVTRQCCVLPRRMHGKAGLTSPWIRPRGRQVSAIHPFPLSVTLVKATSTSLEMTLPLFIALVTPPLGSMELKPPGIA